MDVVFRKLKFSDRKEVATLIEKLYREDPGGKPISSGKIQDTFDFLTANPDRGEIMVIDYKGKIIGYCLLVNFWSNQWGGNIKIIDELYVLEEFRLRKIGTNFIEFLIDNNKYDFLGFELEVTPLNTKAIKFYEKLGFKLSENKVYQLDF